MKEPARSNYDLQVDIGKELFLAYDQELLIRKFGLRRPIFTRSTNYGHFTKADLPWEQLDPARLAILKGE